MSHRRPRPIGSGLAVDLFGAGLVAGMAGWTVLSAQLRDGDPTDIVVSLALVATSYAAGRLTSHWAGPVAVAVLATFSVWEFTGSGALDGGPQAGPLGYANANAALAVQVAAIALVAAARCRLWLVRVALLVASLPVLAVTWVNASAAGVALGVALYLVGLIVVLKPPHRSGVAVAAAGTVLVAAVGAQLLIALGAGDATAARVLSERRVALWSDAVDLTRSQPFLGHGPHSFATASPTAASDTDTQAAHSALLETAAETGLVGAMLLLSIAGWGYVALARAVDPGAALVGAAGWTAFALHSLVDYVADFPAVVAVAALALGLAVGPYRQKSSMSPSVSAQAVRAAG